MIWNILPTTVRDSLLVSGSGETHLTYCISLLAEHLRQDQTQVRELLPVLADMALHVWELALTSPEAASMALSLHEQYPFLRPELLPLCRVCAGAEPDDAKKADRVRTMLSKGDFSGMIAQLEKLSETDATRFFWLRYIALLGLRRGELDWYAPWLERMPLPGPLALVQHADYAFALEDWKGAEALYSQAYASTGMTEWLVRAGECHKRLEQYDEAAACWQAALQRRPWQINLLVRLADLRRNSPLPGAQPKGRGQILLYSWNHGQDLALALDALAASDLGDAGITLLDNGSTDTTPLVASANADRFGDRFTLITLPVNVGAPAARNWLLGTREARTADWVVFLDDDALVPPDWLGYFGAALARFPNAGIVGCRVVDHAAPMVLQSVDLHLHPDSASKAPDTLRLLDCHIPDLDFGQYSYLRPALSVTGCCHLFTRAGLASGQFDLCFSPSQFDDLERDLRSALQGISCVYQGHLRIRHSKRTGGAATMGHKQIINARGNFTKLSMSYPPHQTARMHSMDLERQECCLQDCLHTLGYA